MFIKTQNGIFLNLKYVAIIASEWVHAKPSDNYDTLIIKCVTNKHEIILNSFYGDQQTEIKEYMEDLEKKLLNLKDIPF